MEDDVESNVENKDECQDHDVEKPTKNDDKHSIIAGRTNRHNSETNNDECKESVVKYQESFDKSTSLIFDSMKKKALDDEGREENEAAEVAWS